MSHALSARALLLSLALWACVAVGLLAVCWGALAMAEDASTDGEAWDGFGLFLGGLWVAGGLLWAFPHVCLTVWLTRARRRGRPARPIGAASVALSATLLLLQLLYVAGGAAQLRTLSIPLGACVLVLVAGVRVAVEDSRGSA